MNDNSVKEVTNGKAITALILGILSIVTLVFSGLGFIFAIIGLILGIIGIKEIKSLKQSGKKLAVAGIICSSFSIFLTVFLIIISYFAFTNA